MRHFWKAPHEEEAEPDAGRGLLRQHRGIVRVVRVQHMVALRVQVEAVARTVEVPEGSGQLRTRDRVHAEPEGVRRVLGRRVI